MRIRVIIVYPSFWYPSIPFITTENAVREKNKFFLRYDKDIYYVDKSVLVGNRPLVKIIRNYIRESSGIFSISSLVRISMTSFPALTLSLCENTLVHIIKRKLHGGLMV